MSIFAKLLTYIKSQKQKMSGNKIQISSLHQPTAHFIQKTYEILQNDANIRIIHWLSSGRQFAIRDIAQFQDQILPVYFRHRNIHSFIRQLNMYGFHKSRKDPTKNIFANPYFLKGREQLLPLVRRKVKNEDRNEQNSLNLTIVQNSVKKNTPAKRNQHQNVPAKLTQQQNCNKVENKDESMVKEDSNNENQTNPYIAHSEQNIFEFQSMICPSKVMHQNPQMYSKIHATEQNILPLQQSDDNISIEDQIEKERKVFMNRISGVSILQTYNLLKTKNFLGDQ